MLANNGDCVISFFIITFIACCMTVGNPLLGGGQWQAGVSLKLYGAAIPNNSIVDVDDLLYTGGSCCEEPSNANPELHDRALLCVTDLVDCCESPRTIRGDWYYPDGRIVQYAVWGSTFRRNRGPNEVRNGRQFSGSVRLFCRYSRPPERGRFHCELPNASDPNVNQILYTNILDFSSFQQLVTISSSGSNTAGEIYLLICTATLVDPVPLPSDVPSPTFEWFFGLNSSDSLSSGVTVVPMATVTVSSSSSISITYTSTLKFSPLTQSHERMYTCRLGAGSLVNSVMVTVNEPVISAQITTRLSEASIVGQKDYSLVCSIIGAENLNSTISYQWTKNNGTQIHIQTGSDPSALSFSHFRLSDVGEYTCQATVSSPYLHNITVIASQYVAIQIPSPISVTVSSNILNPIRPIGSSVTLICTVQLSPAVDIPVTVNTVWTGPTGFMMNNIAVGINATIYISISLISSFGSDQFGNYTCAVTVSSTYANFFLSDSNLQSGTSRVAFGQYLESEVSFPCFRETGMAVGVLILIEGIIAVAMVLVCKFIKRKRSSKYDVAVAANTAYGQAIPGEVQEDSEYEDPYSVLAGSGHGQETNAPTENEFSVGKLEAPVYATVDHSRNITDNIN